MTPDHLQSHYGYRIAAQLAAGTGHDSSQACTAAASGSSENRARDDSSETSARAATNDDGTPACVDRGFRNGYHRDGRQGDTIRERGG